MAHITSKRWANESNAKHADQEKTNNDLESMRLLAEMYPTLREDQHREILETSLTDQDSKTMVEHYRKLLVASKSGVVLGATTPPPGADLKWFDFDVHRIFYHSLYPPNHPNPGSFCWMFYIGERDKGVEFINPDATELYPLKMLDMTGHWTAFKAMMVLPGTRVRIFRRGSEVHELVFPPDPKEKSTSTIHYLPV
ncbi:hypothetical protein DFH06DRAFT_1440271 [Mycena polygramma]|nr:hypothetical protein DFH06DRAFT_1440271 [Mycena polygramma]